MQKLFPLALTPSTGIKDGSVAKIILSHLVKESTINLRPPVDQPDSPTSSLLRSLRLTFHPSDLVN